MQYECPKLEYIVQGSACYLVNTGERDILELQYACSFVGFEDGASVCAEYGRWRVRMLPGRSYFLVHQLTQEDIAYLPLRSGWFELDVDRILMAEETVPPGQCVLRATEKWGGFQFTEALIEPMLEPIEQTTTE